VTVRLVPAVGESFGEYIVESILGRGGMGTVYLATHSRLGRKVALKVIAAELSHDEDFRERFLRESRIAASLDHPNVIPIYDAGEVDGELFLAMRFVPGSSLQAEIEEIGPLATERVLAVAAQIGGALDAAHAGGLVHRDVKPANVLVAEPGGHLYLCDFGLAKETSSRGATRTGSFFGTVDYAAPEQIQGLQTDGRADLYALGCVLFHCLTGKPPFVRDSDFAVLQAHLADPPSAPSSVLAELPSAVDPVIVKALAKSPDARYPTAASLAADLERAVSGTSARPAAATREAPVADDQPTRAIDRMPDEGQGRRPAGVPRRWSAVAFVTALVIAAALGTFLIARGRDHGTAGSGGVATFVDRIENVLEQSAGGRNEIGIALAAGLKCTITPRQAGQRIASVTDNRQSILDQLGSLEAPTQETARVVTLLQRALEQSIEADRHYRDGFFDTSGRVCPVPSNPAFVLARRSDASATEAKERFVASFNRLAKRVDRRIWLASQI
jgi:predicted Ser/Thr protein kinase